MRIALVFLCIGGVTFLLRVLAASLNEAKTLPSSIVIHFAKFKPSRQRGELVEMKLEDPIQHVRPRSGERIAL